MKTISFFKRRYYQILLISLLVFLPSSSFFLPSYLTSQLQQGTISDKNLTLALKLHLPSAHHYALMQHKEFSHQWIKYAVMVAEKDALLAFKLGNYFLEKNKIEQAELWFKQSLTLGYILAAKSLSLLYEQEEGYEQAKALLTLYLHNEHILAYALELAIKAGDKDFVLKYWQKLATSRHYQSLLQEINDFGVLSFLGYNERLKSQKVQPLNTCSNVIQLFATSLANLRKSVKLINTFQKHALADYFCFQPPKYVTESFLACKQNIGADAISCDETVWQYFPEKINARYLAIMLPKGGANVHQGILYLDEQDSSDVFIHELSHLLGFIDEYPLVKSHNACQQNNAIVGHNFIVLPTFYNGKKALIRKKILALLPWGKLILPSTPILTKRGHKWQLGTPSAYKNQLGVFMAKGCAATTLQAYKPLKGISALEYLDAEFPEAYLKILALAPNKYLMPSYIENIKFTEQKVY